MAIFIPDNFIPELHIETNDMDKQRRYDGRRMMLYQQYLNHQMAMKIQAEGLRYAKGTD